MLLDLINPSNQNSFNIKLAHTIGLESAIYCNELLNILGKVEAKNKFDAEGYFKLDRKYVFKRTTISEQDQYTIDDKLENINLITRRPGEKNILKFDINLLSEIISQEDLSLQEDLRKKTKIKNGRETKETKRAARCIGVKNYISSLCKDSTIAEYMCKWIESVYDMGKGLSKNSAELFYNNLNNYCKGDLDRAIRILEIATTLGYRECNWAINKYEDEIAQKSHKMVTLSNDKVSKGRLGAQSY